MKEYKLLQLNIIICLYLLTIFSFLLDSTESNNYLIESIDNYADRSKSIDVSKYIQQSLNKTDNNIISQSKLFVKNINKQDKVYNINKLEDIYITSFYNKNKFNLDYPLNSFDIYKVDNNSKLKLIPGENISIRVKKDNSLNKYNFINYHTQSAPSSTEYGTCNFEYIPPKYNITNSNDYLAFSNSIIDIVTFEGFNFYINEYGDLLFLKDLGRIEDFKNKKHFLLKKDYKEDYKTDNSNNEYNSIIQEEKYSSINLSHNFNNAFLLATHEQNIDLNDLSNLNINNFGLDIWKINSNNKDLIFYMHIHGELFDNETIVKYELLPVKLNSSNKDYIKNFLIVEYMQKGIYIYLINEDKNSVALYASFEIKSIKNIVLYENVLYIIEEDKGLSLILYKVNDIAINNNKDIEFIYIEEVYSYPYLSKIEVYKPPIDNFLYIGLTIRKSTSNMNINLPEVFIELAVNKTISSYYTKTEVMKNISINKVLTRTNIVDLDNIKTDYQLGISLAFCKYTKEIYVFERGVSSLSKNKIVSIPIDKSINIDKSRNYFIKKILYFNKESNYLKNEIQENGSNNSNSNNYKTEFLLINDQNKSVLSIIYNKNSSSKIYCFFIKKGIYNINYSFHLNSKNIINNINFENINSNNKTDNIIVYKENIKYTIIVENEDISTIDSDKEVIKDSSSIVDTLTNDFKEIEVNSGYINDFEEKENSNINNKIEDNIYDFNKNIKKDDSGIILSIIFILIITSVAFFILIIKFFKRNNESIILEEEGNPINPSNTIVFKATKTLTIKKTRNSKNIEMVNVN